MARRRLVVAGSALVILALVLSLGVWAGLRTRVYWTRVSLVLVAPSAPFRPNPLESAPPDLPVAAALVVLRMNGGPRAATSSTMDATLYGEGLRIGHRVSLRNVGSQWQASLGEPIIDVEVVGPSAEWVLTEADRLITQASDELRNLQDELGADPNQRVHLSVSPFVPTVSEIGSSRARLLGATSLLFAIGVILAIRFSRAQDARTPSESAFGRMNLSVQDSNA